MSREEPRDIVARIAAEIASKTALDVYTKQLEKEKKRRRDRRLRDTKRLMKSYREIKIHAGDAIASLSEVVSEDYEFFKELMEDNSTVDVGAIVRSKARSAIMLNHIDAMLRTYEIICLTSKKPEEQRRYRVLEAMYIKEEPEHVEDIADRENIDVRTVYRDLDAACEKLSALLFGIQWIERD